MDLTRLEEQLRGVSVDIHQPDRPVLRIGQDGPVVDWHIHCQDTLQRVLKHPELDLGNSYVKGEWDIDTRHLARLIAAVVPQTTPGSFLRQKTLAFLQRLRARLPHVRQSAPQPRWYETSLWLSRLCLGDELFAGCPCYNEPGISLEQAQRTACRHLITRLRLRRDQHLLDLNAGWGALPLYLAEHVGLRVTALVSSREQLQVAHGEARRRGLDGSVHFRLGSFYRCRGQFDRIVASDFLESYTQPAYKVLFERLQALLQDDGMIWLEVAGRGINAGFSNHWHRQQLPAAHSQPLPSDLSRSVEGTRLRTHLLQDLSDHRLQGLLAQARRYHNHRAAISRRFGETCTRHWEFLLASQITALQWGQLRQYGLVLGNARSRWPDDSTTDGLRAEVQLPVDITQRIPGLARDI